MSDKTIEARLEYVEGVLAETVRRLEKMQRENGTPGSGACICKLPPDRDRGSACAERYRDGVLVDQLNSMLDHRCPHHGEQAQPKLWGRHREKELLVTPAQWDSLGIKRART